MSAASGRQGILSLAVKDKAALYNAYMPYIRHGGIFVPTPKRYFLGDEVFLLLTLPETSDRMPVAGKVVWVTPAARAKSSRAGSRPCWPASSTPTRRPRRCRRGAAARGACRSGPFDVRSGVATG